MDEPQWRRAQLQLRRGGCGLRCASRLRFAAYWASWADSLAMIRERHPEVAARLVQQLEAGNEATAPSAMEAAQAAGVVAASGFEVPSWQALAEGAPPEASDERELGDFVRGWQRAASIPRDAAEEGALTQDVDNASRALLLSQSGTYASRHITVLPTVPEFRVPSAQYRVFLLRRLRMVLPLSARRCSCRRFLDPLGDHRAACARAGLLGPRGMQLERAAGRRCSEAGARVAWNVFLRDMNLDVPVTDERRIEVVANGLPIWRGAQLAVDTTLVCPARADGAPRPQADQVPGLALRDARRRKRRQTYRELRRARRCRLVVLGFEVGGRWHEESVDFVRRLARARALQAPAYLQRATAQSFAHRWSALLAVAAQRAFASSLLELPLQGEVNLDGEAPAQSDLLADGRWAEEITPSRMPLRS